jgi:hypothetical protein
MIQTGGSETLVPGAVFDEAIRDSQIQDWQGYAESSQAFVDSAAGPAGDCIVLDRHQRPVASCESQYELFIEGLDEAHVDDRRIQNVSHCTGCRHHRPESEQGYLGALTTYCRLADRDCLHLTIDLDPRSRTARVTDGRWLVEHDPGVEHLPALVLVSWRHDHHVGYTAQIAQIKCAVMSRSVGADQAAPVDGKKDRQVLQRHVMDQLVLSPLQECRIDRDYGPHALAGQPGTQGHRVLFRDSDVKVTIGEPFLEFDHA